MRAITRLRHYTEGFVKVAILVLVVIAAMGAGWMYYELTDELTLGIRIVDADLTCGDELPLTVEVKIISEKYHSIHIDWVEVIIYTEKDGLRMTRISDFDITVPANGEVTRTYDVVLVNFDEVDESIYIVLTVRHHDGTIHVEREVNLDEYL